MPAYSVGVSILGVLVRLMRQQVQPPKKAKSVNPRISEIACTDIHSGTGGSSLLPFAGAGLPRAFIHLHSVEVPIDLVLCHQLIVGSLFHHHPLAVGHVVRKLSFRILSAE